MAEGKPGPGARKQQVVHRLAAHLQQTRGRDGGEHGAVLQQVARDLRAQTLVDPLPQLAGADGGGRLGNISVESEGIRTGRHVVALVAESQDVPQLLPFNVV